MNMASRNTTELIEKASDQIIPASKSSLLSDSTSTSEDFTSKVIGDFGKWQLILSILMALLKLPIAWFQLGIVFLAPEQNFWCEKPATFENYTDSEWRLLCKPETLEQPCLIYDPVLLTSMTIDKKLIPLVPCTKFVYDNSIFESTIISEWDLVCRRQWLVQLSQCILMWGVLVGNMIFGFFADKYGRKLPLMVAIVMQSLTSFLSSMLPWYWTFLINRFFLALASGGISVISFVMCMEIVSGPYRTIIPVLYQIPFGIGNTIMAGLAFIFRDWRSLEFTLASLSSMFLVYYWLVPESPRWLLATGQTEKAVEVLKKAAAVNKLSVNVELEAANFLNTNSVKEHTHYGFRIFFKFKNLRTKTILLCWSWFFTGLTFFAFSQYLGQVADNVFLTVALGGIISSPASILCVYIVKHLGRKTAIEGFQVITAVCFLLILAVPKNMFVNDWPRIAFAGLGLVGISVSVPALYLFTGELFPTIGRNAGVGGVSMFSRIGSMIAPVIVSLDHIYAVLPLLLLAMCSILQTFLVVPLPETKGCPLPDTLEQAEMFDKEYSINYRKQKMKRRLMKK